MNHKQSSNSQMEVVASDGVEIPLLLAPASEAGAALLMLPALGVRASLYLAMGEELAAAGISCFLFEQRGHGKSALRASRRVNWNFDDYLERDLPAALEAVRERCPGVPVILAGHSLGGHMATVYSGRSPEEIDAIVHVACGFPYYADYPPRQARLVRRLCRMLPLFSIIPGYYPGESLGFGGRESLPFMRQWADWATTGRFDFGGHREVAERVRAYAGPVLSLVMDEDSFVTRDSQARALSPFLSARVESRILSEEEQGEHRGHASWAKAPSGVARAIIEWLRAEGQPLAPLAE